MVEHGYTYEQLTLLPVLKRCSRCGELKPAEEFHLRRSSRDGLQSRCRPCNIETARRFHAENGDHCRARINAWTREVDGGNKVRALRYLQTHPCIDCGEADPVVLEFDHRDRGDKRSGIAELLHHHVRWEVVAAEIAKCDVRCANCHRRKTAREAGWFRAIAQREDELPSA